MDPNNKQKKLTIILAFIYLIILTWIIVFKLSFSLSSLPHLRGLNLIPFAGSVIVNGKIEVSEIILNVLVFVPMGIYISMIKPEWSFIKRVAPIALLSLIYETVQYIFAVGATDITDLLGNTLGGVIGCILYLIILKILREHTRPVLNLLAIVATICLILFFGIIIAANL